jgi:hypothetical protein
MVDPTRQLFRLEVDAPTYFRNGYPPLVDKVAQGSFAQSKEVDRFRQRQQQWTRSGLGMIDGLGIPDLKQVLESLQRIKDAI